ncbi:MAG: DUF3488 and DUF4129 domain-containing transglutaminase family protein [Acidimicrobiia bacterium]
MVLRARLLAPFALAALSAAAALSLGRVFASGRFVAPVLISVALAHAAGALARRLRWAGWATALLQLAALAVLVVVAFGPFSGSGVSLTTQLDRGIELLRTAPPPAPVTDGALLLAVIVTFVVAATADWLAFRRQDVLAAIAPALVLFVWAVTLGTDEHRMATAIGFGAAAAVFLLVQNVAVLDRGRSWLVSGQASRRHWLAPAVLLGVAALAVGAAIAPILPGVGNEPVLGFANREGRGDAASNYRTGVAPFVDVSAKLNQADDQELFTVVADRPDYWRVAALDRFDTESGGQWTLRAAGDQVTVGLPKHGPPGSFRQQFTIGNLGERWLPAAFQPVAITLDGTLVVVSSWTLVAAADSVAGLGYTVDSAVPATSSQVSSSQQAKTAAPVPADLAAFTELPSLPGDIAAKAREVTAGATTPYAQAAALRDWFRGAGGFVYDTTVDPIDTPDAISAFLREKRGFCVQFASAYAVMARTLGIPARVAVGFTPGTAVDGVFHVSAHDAHAWPEIWLAGLGWTHLFDPTPSANTVPTGGSDLPDEAPIPVTQVSGGRTPATTLAPPSGTGTAQGTTPPTAAPTTTPSGATPSGPATPATPEVTTDQPGGGTSPWLVVAMIALLACALAGGYVLLVRSATERRRARRRGAEPALAVQGAWDEALDHLRQSHVATDPALTPLELARVIPEGAPAASRPLRDLARRYTTVRYGADVPTPDDAARAWEATDALTDALDADLTWRERWQRRLDPRALTRAR